MSNTFRTGMAAVATAVLVSYSALAADKKPGFDPVPKADAIKVGELHDATRAALGCAAYYLLARAETNRQGVVVDPLRRQQITGYGKKEPYEIRYAEKEFDIPVWEYQYEEYEDFDVSRGASTEGRKMGKVTRKRIVGQKQTGTRKEKRLVQDPNGPIVQTHIRYSDPIYQGAPDIWTTGYLGQNALALLALLKAGVPPDNPQITQLAETLIAAVHLYGAPDTTWDVAWLAAAFANYPESAVQRPSVVIQLKEVRATVINKLLNGQITDGPGRGLWGPVCINTKLLAAMVAYEETLNKELNKRQERVKVRPETKGRKERVADVEGAIKGFADAYRGVAQQGLRFDQVTVQFNAAPNDWTPGAIVLGLPYYFYSQMVADAENTSLAIYAIREAQRNGFLPERTTTPEIAKGKELMPGEEPSAILARTAAALAGRQQQGGGWDECNVHEAINHFKALGLQQLDAKSAFELPSRQTPLSTVHGYAALIDAGQTVGVQKMLGRYAQNVTAGRRAVLALAESLVDNAGGTEPVGGVYPPYELFFRLTGVQRAYGGIEEDRRDLWDRLAFRLVMTQGSDGTWGEGVTPLYSTGLWALQDALACKAHDEAQTKLSIAERKIFDSKQYWAANRWDAYNTTDARAVSTAMAMLFLADGVRPPVAGYAATESGAPPSPVLAQAGEGLGKKVRGQLGVLRLGPDTKASRLKLTPVVFAGSRGVQSDAKLRAVLQEYVAGGGTLAVEVRDAPVDATLEGPVAALVPGGKVRAVDEKDPLAAALKGARLGLRGVYDGKGRLAAVFLPYMTAPGAVQGLLSPAAATEVAARLMESRADPSLLTPSYANNLKETPDPFVARVGALIRLSGAFYGSAPAVPAEIEAARAAAAAVVGTDEGDDKPAAPAPAVPPDKGEKKADESW